MGYAICAAIAGAALSACATVYNLPLNKPSPSPFTGLAVDSPAFTGRPKVGGGRAGGDVIALSFSGGGTRAAAFAYGVLDQLGHTTAPRHAEQGDLLDKIGVVSGVSGGSVMAAYYGLKGRAALADFRQQFLDQDLMGSLDTKVNLINVSRALGGGTNTDNKMRDWLNEHLFHGATYRDLVGRRPITVINATDIYHRTTFVFSPLTFAAACSEIGDYPIAGAVAASAAVPAAFAPVVIENFPNECQTPLPEWVRRVSSDASAAPLLQSYARGLSDIRAGHIKYIKLFDGGLIDNFGLSGITIVRASQVTPYGPLLPEEAVGMRRLLFLVVDAGQGPQGEWAKTLEGPAGKDLMGAVVDALVEANSNASYTAFEATMRAWQNDMVRWRCGLKAADAARLRGNVGPWSCRDLKITVARISFDQLDAARAKVLNAVPTSFTLPPASVDALIHAGGDALNATPAYQAFLKDL